MTSPLARPTELRLALTMRGGVSLAVWMGGACREVARLRSHEGPYRDLLAMCGYTGPVVVDVLTGTSAGGLNGVLLAQHVVCGASFDSQVRDLWLQVADLEQLSRKPWGDPPDSLLLGDEGFFLRLKGAMQRLAKVPEEAAPHPLRLLVTATRLRARPDALFPAVGMPLLAGSSRAFFRFRYPGSQTTGLSDFADSGSMERLAYAARTTSSFPGAFEPATPHVADTSQGDPLRFYGVSSETGRPDPDLAGRVQLADGGILDNIPISWAIRSIAGMPADSPVDRWLLYLQPVSASRAVPGGDREEGKRARLVKVLRAAASLKGSTESVLDDGQELRAAAAAASQVEAGLSISMPAGLDALATTAEASFLSYRANLGLAEAARLRTLLTDPLSLLGPDPLPVPGETFPLQTLAECSTPLTDGVPPLRIPTEGTAAGLVLPASAVWSDVGRGARSPLCASRAATILLHVLRQAEAAGPLNTAALRQRLYVLRSASEMAVAARDRALLLVATADAARTPEQLFRHAAASLAGVLPESPTPTANNADWSLWTTAVGEAVADLTPPPGPPADFPDELYAPLWDALVATTKDVALLIAPSRPGATSAAGSVAMATTQAAAGTVLSALEVMTGRLRPDPLLSPSCPQFAVASASNVSPLEREIFGVDLDGRNRVDSKLSGNQVSNFAAFLSARWRLNDWIWGRLDGAQTLVAMIAREERLPESLRPSTVRDLFVGSADPEWRVFLDSRWTDTYEALANTDARTALALSAVERLQWDILRDELPLLHVLSQRPSGRDRPPTFQELTGATLTTPEAVLQSLPALGAVGREQVVELLPRSDLRRSLMRLVLVAWRAALPAGGMGRVVRWLLWPTVAPVLLLPTLLAVVAPVASVAAAAAIWGAVAVATGSWGSAAHIPTVLGVSLACAVWCWQRWTPGVLRRKLETGDPPGWWRATGLPLAAGLLAGLVTGGTLWLAWGDELSVTTTTRFWLTALFGGSAVVFPLIYTVTETGVRGAITARRLAPGWSLRAGIVLALGVITGGVAAVIASAAGPRPETGFLVEYVGLVLALAGLYILLSIRRPT